MALLYELAFFAFIVFTGISSSSVLGTKPNFVFVLVDEWEYADVSQFPESTIIILTQL